MIKMAAMPIYGIKSWVNFDETLYEASEIQAYSFLLKW